MSKKRITFDDIKSKNHRRPLIKEEVFFFMDVYLSKKKNSEQRSKLFIMNHQRESQIY